MKILNLDPLVPLHAYLLGFVVGRASSRERMLGAGDSAALTQQTSGVSAWENYHTLDPELLGTVLDIPHAFEKVTSLGEASLSMLVLRGLVEGSAALGRGRLGEPTVELSKLPRGARNWASSILASEESELSMGDADLISVQALDVLGRIYDGHEDIGRPTMRAFYEAQLTSVSHLNQKLDDAVPVRVQRVNPAALPLKKERISDSGYDLTLIDVKKTMGIVTLYGTGWIIQPPEGWYFDVVPRSSIIKRGYILANSVGIIDRSYRGEIMVPLIKLDPSAPDLELPARVAQLIPRPIVHFHIKEVEHLTVTERGAGGFGSTGR